MDSLMKAIDKARMGWTRFLPEIGLSVIFQDLESAQERVAKAQKALRSAKQDLAWIQSNAETRILAKWTAEEIRAARDEAAR